jgi:hypothetical protein
MEQNSASYGLMTYSSINIGDEAQSVAAQRFIPKVNYWVSREQMHKIAVSPGTKIFLNGWWMWNPRSFPPSSNLNPLLISMYIRESMYPMFAKSKSIVYLKKFGPVGARDTKTLDFLESIGVPAYLSRCLTLTLRSGAPQERGEFVLAIDVDRQALKGIKTATSRPVFSITPLLTPSLSQRERLALAEMYLHLIQKAACVVSPRLHALLPSLALGTPVCRIIPDGSKMDSVGRFSGYETYFPHAIEQNARPGTWEFDFDNPPENVSKHNVPSQALVEAAATYTGYDRGTSFTVRDEEVVPSLFNLLRKRRVGLSKSLWFVSQNDLMRVLFQRTVLRRNKHGLQA